MSEQAFFSLRCLKCTCHFSNILKMEGMVKVEKKCPKCKCLNIITLTNKEIVIQCKMEPESNGQIIENGFNGKEGEEY